MAVGGPSGWNAAGAKLALQPVKVGRLKGHTLQAPRPAGGGNPLKFYPLPGSDGKTDPVGADGNLGQPGPLPVEFPERA